MTALSEYERLEATGLWRPAPNAQRRDVIVSVGEATLVMTDQSDRALAHWSLAALIRRNPGETPALYAPGQDATEELEIDDAEMIAAIERVRRAVERSRPKPGRLRARIAAGSVAALVLVGLFWLPDAAIRHAARVAPEAARSQIGASLLAEVERIAGGPCSTVAGDRALARLKTRLMGSGPGEIVVLRGGGPKSVNLPGGIVVLDRSVVEDHETPEVAAGFVLAELARAAEVDPLLRLLDRSGLRAAFALLTRGRVPEDALRGYAEYILTARSDSVRDAVLLAAFERAKVRSSPYAYAMDISGEDTLPLIEADPVAVGASAPVLSDGDWVALQGICGS